MPDDDKAKTSLIQRLNCMMPNRGDIPQMAQKTGIPKQTIQNWCKGIGEPNITNAVRLADAAGVNLLWLATGRGTMNSEDALLDRDFAGIQEGALVESIRVVVSVMSDMSIELSPEAQARIVAAIYDEQVSEGQIVSRDRARRYLKLVVGG